ncbi:hypothetical protein D9756_007287 [Leucocoprinus leucothites]|uniref:Uncharacterized protein n=1 Tax=Leucocoprinus leucothites TaxID=201217 RepID=A0A8H5D5D5_9AGAR|nr:hypothetical protein D9756_007287 [Leucoagaricus leucothites]
MPQEPPSIPGSTHRVVIKEPATHMPPLGASFVGTSVSIEDYLREKLLSDVFEGPLTDYEDSETDGAAPAETPSAALKAAEQGPSSSQLLLATPHTPLSNKARKQKERSAKRRRKKREDAQAAEPTKLKHVTKRRRLEATKNLLLLDLNAESDVPVSKPAWIGRRAEGLPRRQFTKGELVEDLGLTHFPWGGRTTHLLLDRKKRVIGVLLGQPRDSEGWKKVHDAAYEAFQTVASKLSYSKKELSQRRGDFPAVAHGISFGGGQEEPKHLSHSAKKTAILDGLMQEKSVQRICKFGSCGFHAYSQRNYEYMESTVEKLRAHYDSAADNRNKLRRPYDSAIGVFPCRSLNLGKQSISFPHTDEGNLAQSWCSITPVGSFDPSTGGHLVLWDFGLVIDFPPGATALIPSALIRHSNTSIAAGETRFSTIQYAAGGLYRWVYRGFMSEKDWRAQANEADLEEDRAEQEQRWRESVKMFTTLGELLPRSDVPSANATQLCSYYYL